MPAKPTYFSLAPTETRGFSRRDRMTTKRRIDYGQAKPEEMLPAAFDVPALVNPVAVAAIKKAFLTAKSSHEALRSYKREGRFDPRQAPRASRREQDVFARRAGKSTTRVKVSVLIDASGSMGDPATMEHPNIPGKLIRVTRTEAAAVFGATIAKALGSIPTVTLDVFQHAASSDLYLKWRWTRGTPIAVFNENVSRGIPGGGNADGHALYAVTERLIKSLKRDEHGVIMVVSDGMPSVYGNGGTSEAGQALIDAVAYARSKGIEVIAVAIDGSDQSVYYGKDGMVPFTGSWIGLGTALAKVVGKALARPTAKARVR